MVLQVVHRSSRAELLVPDMSEAVNLLNENVYDGTREYKTHGARWTNVVLTVVIRFEAPAFGVAPALSFAGAEQVGLSLGSGASPSIDPGQPTQTGRREGSGPVSFSAPIS